MLNLLTDKNEQKLLLSRKYKRDNESICFDITSCGAFPHSNLINEKTYISTDYTSDFNFIWNYNKVELRNCS